MGETGDGPHGEPSRHSRPRQLRELDTWNPRGRCVQRELRHARYHPLFCFNYFGDVEAAMLREGNVASADEWQTVLEPVVESYCLRNVPICLRGDAAFAIPAVCQYLEDNNVLYAIRIKANPVLERHVAPLLERRVGAPQKGQRYTTQALAIRPRVGCFGKSWSRSSGTPVNCS